jgi:hypothetical protein
MMNAGAIRIRRVQPEPGPDEYQTSSKCAGSVGA